MFNKFLEYLDKDILFKITSLYEDDYINFAKCLCIMHKENIIKTKEYKAFVLKENKKDNKKDNKKENKKENKKDNKKDNKKRK